MTKKYTKQMKTKQTKSKKRHFDNKKKVTNKTFKKTSNKSPKHKMEKNKLKIIPLGGMEEVGRNMTIFEYGQDIVILDMGLQFPEEDMPGIDYIIPDISYLRGKEKNIKAIIFSHGHLDHIGAAPLLLEKLGNPPIVGRNLTLAMIKHRLEDYKKGSSKKIKTIHIKNLKDKMRFGIFQASFFQIEHSIMDAVGLILKTPVGTIIHSGDWTLEKDKNGKLLLDYKFLTKLPKPRILMLESLGAVDVRPSASTEEMKENLTKLITKASSRVIIGTFSSQIERINWILQLAEKLKKKVVLDGFSMKTNIEIAKKLGYIKTKKDTFINIDKIDDYPDNKIVIIVTGAQGEGNAVLSRVIDGRHRHIKLRKSDMVILSSSIIPGNERTIQRLKDNLYRQCDNVIHGNIMDIHVSGHGNRQDIIYMLKTIRPEYFIPVYANHYMLKEAAHLAREVGIREKNIFVPDNGQITEFTKNNGRLTDKKVPTDYVMVDGLGVGDVSHIVLRDRRIMSEDGMLVIIVTLDKQTGNLIGNPDLISRGFIYMKENKKLVEEIRNKVKKLITNGEAHTPIDKDYIKNRIRNEIGQFVFSKIERRPMVLPVVIEV